MGLLDLRLPYSKCDYKTLSYFSQRCQGRERAWTLDHGIMREVTKWEYPDIINKVPGVHNILKWFLVQGYPLVDVTTKYEVFQHFLPLDSRAVDGHFVAIADF